MLVNDSMILSAACDQLICPFRKSLDLSRLDVQMLLLFEEANADRSKLGLSPSSLACELAVSQVHVVNRLRVMLGRGLLRKSGNAAGRKAAAVKDARRMFYVLTAKGRKMSKRVKAGMGRIDEVVRALATKQGEAGIQSLAQALVTANSLGLLEDPAGLAGAIGRLLPAGRHKYGPLLLARAR